ncbi:variable surface protein [Plasmodium gonderi]|uniref:Variable surface protein n=1 Tax=Plasmodium gonderi TaxID=77519 RepID=A0A1Y1JS83_PLAGO|nr:variable surface protein [Plasmodium gonderi]GAW84308.1 variable surface protein [Plasmodium gonderi]
MVNQTTTDNLYIRHHCFCHFQDDVSKSLNLNNIFEEFFKDDEKSNSINYCNSVDKHNDYNEINDLCGHLINYLRKIPQVNDWRKRYDYCDYLTYWLHDKVGYIYKKDSEKTGNIPFFKNLIDVMNKVNAEYKKQDCKGFIFWSSGPNYADCSPSYKPDELISKLYECKNEGHENVMDVNVRKVENEETLKSEKPENAVSLPNSGPAESPIQDSPGQDLSSQNSKDSQSPGLPIPSDSRTLTLESSEEKESLYKADPIHYQTVVHVSHESYDVRHNDSRTILTPREDIVDSSNFLQRIYDILYPKHFRHLILGTSIVLVASFLIFFFMSTSLGSQLNKMDERKREYESNYCNKDEEELSEYGSELEHTNPSISEVYLSYEPRRDYFG